MYQVIVEERDEEIRVRVLVHSRMRTMYRRAAAREYTDCPVRVWLEEPLGDRGVIDFDRDEELPLYRPLYLNNLRQHDHGYYEVGRRGSGLRRK